MSGRPEAQAWTLLADDTVVWHEFGVAFDFRPSVEPANWPAITEPSPSVTFDLTEFKAKDDLGSIANFVDESVHGAFKQTAGDNAVLSVLDWNHVSYSYRPGVFPDGETAARAQQISPFPNGDYHVFLNSALTEGTFGHPWEQTLCVFGPDMVRTAGTALSARLPITRRRTAE